MTETTNTQHLEAAVEALAVARDELRRAGMDGEAETVAALGAEMACEADTVAALWEGRLGDLETLRGPRDGGRNDLVEDDRDREEKFGPAHPAAEEDGCEGCGSFSHPSKSCAGEAKGKQGMRERVVAEAELLAGAKYRVIRDEHADYFTEYSEGERVSRVYQRSLDAALELFAGAVRECEDGDPGPTFEEDPAAVRYPLT